jgi:hypothetical protein
MMEGETQALARKALELALKGDTAALRLCLDRIAPRRKEGFIEFPLPKITNPKEASKATGTIVRGLSEGQITQSESEALLRAVEAHVRVLDYEGLERRVAEVERALAKERELELQKPRWLRKRPEDAFSPPPRPVEPGDDDDETDDDKTNKESDAKTNKRPQEESVVTPPPRITSKPDSSWMNG